MLKKGDIVLIACLIASVIVGFAVLRFFRGDGYDSHRIAVIKQNDKIIKRIDLDEVQKPERIDVSSGFYEVILVERGRIRFEEANCPDLVCVKTGWLTEKGDVAVCLPNRTIIRIEGEGEKVDGGTY